MHSHQTKTYEINSIIQSIENQFWKNDEMYKVITQQSNCEFQKINAMDFLQEIQQQLKQPKQNKDQIMMKCQEMVDKLLDEEYTLDRMVSKLKTKKRRNVKISTGNVLQVIDENIQHDLIHGPKTVGDVKIKSNFFPPQNNQNTQIQYTQEINNNPIEELQFINQQVKECLELIDQNIENKQINDNIDDEYNKIKDQLQQIKDNKVYDDENMEVFILYKNNKRKVIPNLQINY